MRDYWQIGSLTMLKTPLISFVVTSYNYEKYILKTLESIKAQTYRNFEIIVVDDCSTDSSCEIVENFISDNQNMKITLIKQEKNCGQFGAMIKGLEVSTGQFVSFIDSDDILMENYAQNHIRVHLETSVAFTSCQIAEIGEDDEVHTFSSIASPHSNYEEFISSESPKYEIINKRFGGWYWSPNSSAMFRKASIELIKEYKNIEKWKICPDKFLFNFAHLIGGSAIIYTPLVGYRRHGNNSGNSSLVTGDKRLHSDKTTLININNNIKIRPETIKFLWQVKNKLGKRNTVKFILTVLKSYLF